MPVSENMVLIGMRDTKKALKEYAPDVLKAMNADIRKTGNALAIDARAEVPATPPMRGWRTVAAANPSASGSRGAAGWPAWDASAMRIGVKFKAGGRRRQRGSTTSDAYSLVNMSAAGAIYEIAGRKASGQGTGVQLIANLNSIAKASRAIWKTLDGKGIRATQEAIAAALEKAEAELAARLAAANDRDQV